MQTLTATHPNGDIRWVTVSREQIKQMRDLWAILFPAYVLTVSA